MLVTVAVDPEPVPACVLAYSNSVDQLGNENSDKKRDFFNPVMYCQTIWWKSAILITLSVHIVTPCVLFDISTL